MFFKGRMEVIARLFELGESIDDNNDGDMKNACTPLLVAIVTRRKNVIEFLLDRGANIDGVVRSVLGREDVPYLCIASELGYADIVEFLIERGADIDKKSGRGHWYGDPLDNSGWTALVTGWTALVTVNGPPWLQWMDRPGYSGWTALVTAICYHREDVIKVSIERGPDISVTSDDDLTPLYFGIIAGNIRILKLLLERIEALLSSYIGNDENEEEENAQRGERDEEGDDYDSYDKNQGLDIFYGTGYDEDVHSVFDFIYNGHTDRGYSWQHKQEYDESLM